MSRHLLLLTDMMNSFLSYPASPEVLQLLPPAAHMHWLTLRDVAV